MCKSDVIRAWKDEDYRMSLSEAERRMLPTNPAGLIEISDSQLGAVAGGDDRTIVFSYPAVCSCFGPCNSQFLQICTGDWFDCPTSGFDLCPWLPSYVE